MDITVVLDCIHANIGHVPPGHLLAGYTTGSPDIRWTGADWKAHPDALRIDQDWKASDTTADYLDIERGAATIAEAPGWYRQALHSYRHNVRPGQRYPGFYLSASQVTALANQFVAAGIHAGPRLVVANWDLSQAQATAEVLAAGGPYPIVGIQFRSLAAYDINVFSGAWVRDRSGGGGPYAHKTDGKMTITEIAATRRMHAAGWLELQRHLGGNGVADELGEAVPPAGTPWLSANP